MLDWLQGLHTTTSLAQAAQVKDYIPYDIAVVSSVKIRIIA